MILLLILFDDDTDGLLTIKLVKASKLASLLLRLLLLILCDFDIVDVGLANTSPHTSILLLLLLLADDCCFFI